MNIIDLLLYELENTYSKDDWYSPLKLVISDLTYEQALWKPEIGSINSIWEITAHLLYYKERLLLRLRRENAEYTSNNQETFDIEGNTQQDWNSLVKRMEEVNQDINDHIQIMSIIDLENDKSKHPLWKHINGVIRHDAHHIGQIIFIRKLQGIWSK